MRQVVLLVIALLVMMSSVAYARGDYVTATVFGDKSPTIQVVSLDEPSNPYWGKYSKLDRWAYDNFSYYVTNENYSTIQLTAPNIEQTLKNQGVNVKIMTYKSYVELDKNDPDKGYLVPIMAFMEGDPVMPGPSTLGEAFGSHSSTQEEDKRPYFWSIGIQDESAEREYAEAISVWLAPVYPKIPEWMVTVGHAGDIYNLLPDGGVVVAVPDVKNDFSQRKSQLFRYDASGNVLKQAPGDYMDWESVMLNDVRIGKDNPYLTHKQHFSESGRLSGTSSNIACTGRYRTYRNDTRDGFLAVVDYWQGKVLTPADCDLNKLIVDPYPYFGMVDYEEIVRVYKAQQALASKS
jgi:hypothetical protein